MSANKLTAERMKCIKAAFASSSDFNAFLHVTFTLVSRVIDPCLEIMYSHPEKSPLPPTGGIFFTH